MHMYIIIYNIYNYIICIYILILWRTITNTNGKGQKFIGQALKVPATNDTYIHFYDLKKIKTQKVTSINPVIPPS